MSTKRCKMSDSNKVTTADIYLEELRCSVCNEYLSCPPIQLLLDGKNICGNCKSEDPSYRNLILEIILTNVSFPCKYELYGCEERIIFGEVNKHHSTCDRRAFPCHADGCLWEGSIGLLSQHFTGNHRNLILDKAEFKLNVEKNKERIVMVVLEGINFMLKYKYRAAAHELYYDVRFFKSVQEASCKIRLINALEPDYNMCVKGNPCQEYDYSFNNLEISNMLTLNNVLPLLNQPKEVIVAMDLSFIKAIKTELFTCTICKRFLAIPFFENNCAKICANCRHEFCVPAANEDLLRHVANSKIPCRWNDCKAVKKGDKIREHERDCKHRIYKCIFSRCSDYFNTLQISYHMNLHSYKKLKLLSHNFILNFSKEYNTENYYVKYKNEIIAVRSDTNQYAKTFKIVVNKTEYANDIKTMVRVNHSHCDLFKEFNVSKELTIRINMLPKCFKITDDLNVTVQIQ